jgi:hypothetical protein
MISRLMDRFPDAQFVVFNLHGMGPNDSDAASMALLPELLYRQQFGARCLDATDNRPAMTAVPLVRARQSWNNVVDQALPPPLRQRRRIVRWYDRIRSAIAPAGNANSISLDWMPAARYRCFWPAMRAFALPSFYDGRIRINLRGRESNGIVEPEEYEAACDEVESVLRECRNFSTGEAIVARIDRNSHPPGSLADSEADIMVVWRGAALGFDHPRLGRIGPLPYRRTGGHTGDSGIAYFFGPDIGPGEYDRRSAFDIVPTVIEMLGESASMPVSGKSFHADIAMSAVREHSGPDEQFNCIGTCCTIAPGSASEISMRVNR